MASRLFGANQLFESMVNHTARSNFQSNLINIQKASYETPIELHRVQTDGHCFPALMCQHNSQAIYHYR